MPSALLLPPLGEGWDGGSRWLNVNGLPCRATSAPVRCQVDGAAARFGQPTPIPAFLQRGKEKNREKSRFAAGMLCLPVSMMPLSQCLKHKRTDQAEREAVGERAVAPASHRHWPPTADQGTQGPAKRWPVRAFSSNPLPIPIPRQLSLVTFFFARKESYPPPGRRSPLNPQKNPRKTQNPRTKKAILACWVCTSSYLFNSTHCRAVRIFCGIACGWLVRNGLMSSPPRRV